MAYADLVHQTTTSTGIGNLTLVNVNGKRTFNLAFGPGGTNVFDYYISNRDAAEWERGKGHEASGALVRDTVLASSNANSAVNFSVGTKDVTHDQPANERVNKTGDTISGALTVNGLFTPAGGIAASQTLKSGGSGAGFWYDGWTTAGRFFVGGEPGQDTTWRVYSVAAGGNVLIYDATARTWTMGAEHLTVGGTINVGQNVQLGNDITTSALVVGTLGHKIGRRTSDGSMLIGGGQTNVEILNPLIVAGDPGTALQVATKQYVDGWINTRFPTTGGSLTGALSLPACTQDIEYAGMSGQLQVFSNTPTDTSITFHRGGAFACNFGMKSDNNFYFGGWSFGAVSYKLWSTRDFNYTPLNKAGDTMGGPLTLAADPSSTMHAATKQYVDNAGSGKAAFRAHKNGVDQTGFADGAWTAVNWPNENFDVGGYFNTGTGAWTPPAGTVLLTATLQFLGTYGAGADCNVAIHKNGTVIAKGAGATSASFGQATVSVVDTCNGTDAYTVYAFPNVSTGTGTVAGTVGNTHFSGVKLA